MTILNQISATLSTANPFGLIFTAFEAAAVLMLTFLLIERVMIEAYGTDKFVERLKARSKPTVVLLVLFCLIVALRLFQMLFAG